MPYRGYPCITELCVAVVLSNIELKSRDDTFEKIKRVLLDQLDKFIDEETSQHPHLKPYSDGEIVILKKK